jgi:hypothetical protein
MVVISGARALRHPSQMAAVLPAAAPSRPHMHHCPQQRETMPVICVKRMATRNSLDYVPGPCYHTIQ